jgi:hypothetical protein
VAEWLDIEGAHARYLAALLGSEEVECDTDPLIRIAPQVSCDGPDSTPKLCAVCGAVDVYAPTASAVPGAAPKLLCYGCFLEETTKSWGEMFCVEEEP